MRIIGTQYTLKRKSLEIYKSGCRGPHCKGCHNPETWEFNQGTSWKDYKQSVFDKIRDFDELIDRIEVFGGEPFDDPYSEILEFLQDLHSTGKEIWVYTRYELESIHPVLRHLCDYIKCGRYEEELKCSNNIQYGINLATSNQKIYKRGIDY